MATICDLATLGNDGESPMGTDGPLTGGAATQKWLKLVRLDQARTITTSDGDLVTWEVRIEDRESFLERK